MSRPVFSQVEDPALQAGREEREGCLVNRMITADNEAHYHRPLREHMESLSSRHKRLITNGVVTRDLREACR